MEKKYKSHTPEWRKARYEANKKKLREYYQRNKERMNNYSKAYYKENREAILEKIKNNPNYKKRRKEWVESHREHMREYHVKYYHAKVKHKRKRLKDEKLQGVYDKLLILKKNLE